MPSHWILYFICGMKCQFEAAADHEHFYSFSVIAYRHEVLSLNTFTLVIGMFFGMLNLLLLWNTCKNVILLWLFAVWMKNCKTYSEIPSTNNQNFAFNSLAMHICDKWTNSMILTYTFLIHSFRIPNVENVNLLFYLLLCISKFALCAVSIS